jgi:small nuclear ribonucleoprotein (snRNP)-like protein
VDAPHVTVTALLGFAPAWSLFPAPSLTLPSETPPSIVAPVPGPVSVRVLLHDDHLVHGIFVSFDQVMNPILHDCVELHPQADRHVPRPTVFLRAAITSLAIEPSLSPSPPLPVALSEHLP